VAERRVSGDGLSLALRTWGDPAAPTVLLVHGFPDTHAVWDLVAARLVEDGFHVAAHDVRGAGASERPPELDAYRIEHLVADLAAVVDEVSPERPVHLVGHDWGAVQGWHAVADPNLDHRIASFTSISGLPLGHVGRWVGAQLRGGHVVRLARQAVRSSYVGLFHLPGVQAGARRGRGAIDRTRPLWARTLRRVEGAQVDDRWPAPTLGADAACGMALYRANVGAEARHPGPVRATPAPVLLLVPTGDRFVPEWIFEGIEAHAPGLRRRRIDAGHWVTRSRPAEVADVVAEHVRAVAARDGGDGPGAGAAP
jgi:pimeloyl-ACP methyl ester carboxylesterase